ncbi:flavohemoprotein [Niveomyces insectorum RCEF 264]|uniref:nitric oxide dioxygenase n=1 Tax=Niveomyces insectorum RCEF 264 TaxID=1081102 RepID=A0A162IYF3_9HYPO|nr:flavohemoprotein [Niveomyces insectorum RCEF 264]
MSLTYKQAKLVQSTLPALREHGEHIASVFYATMLQEHPELKHYFNTVNQANGRQPRALTAIIIAFAANIAHTSELAPRLERVCHKHCSLGIRPDQYAIVGEYLIRAFRGVLGAAMTPDVEAAWTEAYCLLARMMMGREAHLYRSFGPWQGWRTLRVDRKVAESDDTYSFYLVPVPDGGGGSGSSSSGRASTTSFASTGSVGTTATGGSRYSNFTNRLKTNNINILKNKMTSSRHSTLGSASNPHNKNKNNNDNDNSLPYYLPGHVKRDAGTRFANAVAASYFHPGAVSNALIDHVGPGDTLEVSHPAGEFFLNLDNADGPDGSISSSASGSSSNANVPLVLVSAGIGAAPMLAILRGVAAAQPRRAVTYVHGSRDAPAVFADELRDLQRTCPRLQTAFFYSSAAGGSPPLLSLSLSSSSSREFAGRVDLSKLTPSPSDGTTTPVTPTTPPNATLRDNSSSNHDPLFLSNGSTEYFVCGPEAFMLAMAVHLVQELGISRQRIHFELFSTGDLETDSQDGRLRTFLMA